VDEGKINRPENRIDILQECITHNPGRATGTDDLVLQYASKDEYRGQAHSLKARSI